MKGAINLASSENWAYILSHDHNLFFERVAHSLDNEEIFLVHEAMNYLISHVVYLLERKTKGELEQLLALIADFRKKLIYIQHKKPAQLVIMGKLEVTEQLLSSYIKSLPEIDWFVQLKGQYEEKILSLLYEKDTLKMSSIAEHVNISPQQLTPIVNRLEENMFIVRHKVGKNVWCTLTRKGFLMGKYYSKESNLLSVVQLIKEITKYYQQSEPHSRFEQIIEKYKGEFPEVVAAIQPLNELFHKKVYRTISMVGWKDLEGWKHHDDELEFENKIGSNKPYSLAGYQLVNEQL